MGARGKKKSEGGGGADPSDIRPWHRQPGESTSSWEGFIVYRDMDKRSTTGAARILKKTQSSVSQMAHRNQWIERAAAWDREVQDRIDRAEINEIARMSKRQIGIAIGMQTLVAHDVGVMLKQVERENYRARMDPDYELRPVLKPSDLNKMADIATKLERLNRGEPSDITKNISSIDPDKLAGMPTDELERLDAILKKLGQ